MTSHRRVARHRYRVAGIAGITSVYCVITMLVLQNYYVKGKHR